MIRENLYDSWVRCDWVPGWDFQISVYYARIECRIHFKIPPVNFMWCQSTDLFFHSHPSTNWCFSQPMNAVALKTLQTNSSRAFSVTGVKLLNLLPNSINCFKCPSAARPTTDLLQFALTHHCLPPVSLICLWFLPDFSNGLISIVISLWAIISWCLEHFVNCALEVIGLV